MKALIDGDVVASIAGYAAQRTGIVFEWLDENDNLLSIYTDPYFRVYFKELSIEDEDIVRRNYIIEQTLDTALFYVDRLMQSILNNTAASSYLLFIQGEDATSNFRFSIAKKNIYKGGRREKPIHYRAIKDYLVTYYKGILVDGQEVDDALGIEQMSCEKQGVKSIICSVDKDMFTIPGHHYNIRKKSITQVSEHDAALNFYGQLLGGDPVDTVIGLTGFGSKPPYAKARKLLKNCKTVLEMYLEVRKKYSECNRIENLLENGQLLWIRRQPNEIWEPPI